MEPSQGDFLDGDADEEAFYRAWLQETLDSSEENDGNYDERQDDDFAIETEGEEEI